MRPIDRRKSAAWTDVNVTGSGKERRREIHWKIADGRTQRPHFPTEVSRTTQEEKIPLHSQFASVDFCKREREPRNESQTVGERQRYREPLKCPSQVL